MQLPEPVNIICREWKLDSLLSELAVHRLDLVLADTSIPPSVEVRAYSHRLGESALSFFARADLAESGRGAFPDCLDGMPMLLPGEDSAIRAKLLRWLDKQKLRPRFTAEFDDSSLMAAFGQAGVGVFVAPTALEEEVERQHGVITLGRTGEVVAEYFAISVERRLTHPCVLAITRAARDGLFGDNAQ
jgi:LysR family transcriptional activator of nhaA